MSIQKFLAIIFFTVTIAWISARIYAEDNAAYFYRKGLIQYNHQMYNYAVLSLELALGSDPTHVDAANLLAKIYLENYRDRVRALQYFLQSLKANDAQPEIHLEAGKLYYFFSEYQNAREHFQKAIQQKQLVYAHYYLALIYNYEKNFKAAAYHIEQCTLLTGEKVSKKIDEGGRATKQGKYSEAITHYLNAIEINPASKDAYMQLALLYRMQKKIDKAIEILENCMKVYVQDNDVLITLAHVCFEYKHPKRRTYYINRAIELCTRVIENDSSRCEVYSLLFEIYKQLNDVPQRDENATKYDKCVESKSD